jgi:cell division protein FtsI (penicillin-binding protein 3)
MTAYTPDPSTHILDANLAASKDRSRPGQASGKAQRQLRAIAPFRLWLLGLVFLALFAGIAARIVLVALDANARGPLKVIEIARDIGADEHRRSQVVDRNGRVLADNVYRKAAYANPSKIGDLEATLDKLAEIFPDMDHAELRRRLSDRSKKFVYVRRGLTPQQEEAIWNIGEPGLEFLPEQHRVYPKGNLTAHVVGFNDIDTTGLAGIEAYFDRSLQQGVEELELSIDVGIQHIVAEELAAAIEEFEAPAGAAVLLDANTSEVLSLVSLPDYDPYNPASQSQAQRLNRATYETYELGSVFKVFTLAAALESGAVTPDEEIDVTGPLRIGKFKIRDFHPHNGTMDPKTILSESSNIGSAKMALRVGNRAQKRFLRSMGLLTSSEIEVQEVSKPTYPSNWGKTQTITISYGHGIANSPLQVANAFAAIVNGGIYRPATLIKRDPASSLFDGTRVISEQTSIMMRDMLDYVVREGTGGNADAEGYRVGGKTGTADKPSAGAYNEDARIATFLGAFPIEDPKYVLLVMVDEPLPQEHTYGYATGGWVAAPAFKRIVERTAPMLGLERILPAEESD